MKKSPKIFTVSGKNQDEPVVKNTRNFHGTIRWVLILAQCMGQMPVIGIGGADCRYLKFRWKSWRTIYCILNCIGAGFIASLYTYRILTYGVDLFQSTALAFHLSTFMIMLFFLKLATEWPKLMRKWSNLEFAMRTYGWPNHLHTRITIMAVIVLAAAATEYFMIRIHKVYLTFRCKNKDEEFFEYYFTIHLYMELFSIISYAPWKGVLLQVENFLMTFAWSWNDLFVMLISTALALRFRQVTERVKLLKKNLKGENVNVWRETREDYNRLSELTRSLDEALACITLTSFASNLFFILAQLFHSLRKIKDIMEKIYFFYSFGFLILRTICVTIYGAWIYDESKQPLAILNSVSSETYNIEIKRFIEQIKYDTVALTGKNFFYVTRGLILSMAGAIVTYELVLIQFNENLLKESAEKAKNFTGTC